jgi:hypothetical protein
VPSVVCVCVFVGWYGQNWKRSNRTNEGQSPAVGYLKRDLLCEVVSEVVACDTGTGTNETTAYESGRSGHAQPLSLHQMLSITILPDSRLRKMPALSRHVAPPVDGLQI